MSRLSKEAIRTAISHYESTMQEDPQYKYSVVTPIIKGLYQALKEVDKYDEIANFIKIN